MIAVQNIELTPVPIQQLLTPIDIFRRVKPDDSLTKVITNVDSSHEPVFVFSGDHYLGVTSLTKLLFTSRLPYTAKTGKHLIPLPKLTLDSTIFQIAETMQSSRLYALPIVDGDVLIGVIEAGNIFSWITGQPEWMDILADKIIPRQAIIIPETMRASEVRDHLKQLRQSRAVVVDEAGKIQGIITRNDLKDVYLTPPSRQRFSSKDGIKTSFDPPEKITRKDTRVSAVMTSKVNTHVPAPAKQLLRDLITSDFNSVVIIDKKNRPQTILSNRDIIATISKLQPDTIWF